MGSVGSQGRVYSSVAKTSSTFRASWFILTLLATKCSGLVFRSQDRHRMRPAAFPVLQAHCGDSWGCPGQGLELDFNPSSSGYSMWHCPWSSSLPWAEASPSSPAAKHQGGHEQGDIQEVPDSKADALPNSQHSWKTPGAPRGSALLLLLPGERHSLWDQRQHVSSQRCRCESPPHYRGLREGNAPAWNSRLQIPGPERLRLPEHKLGEKQTLRTQKGLCQTSWFFSSSSKVGKGPGISLGKLQCSSMLTPASWWTRGHKRRNCRH